MKSENSIYVNSQRKILPRSTYTPLNAFRWKATFDEAIITGKNVLIPFKPEDSPGYLSPLTLKQQVTDALLWLTDNTPEEPISKDKNNFTRKDYCVLRGSAKIRLMKDGILISFNETSSFTPSIKNSDEKINEKAIEPVVTPVTPEDVKKPHWKTKLTTFLGSNESILFIKNLNLSPEDHEYIHELLKDIRDIEYEVTVNQLKVAK